MVPIERKEREREMGKNSTEFKKKYNGIRARYIAYAALGIILYSTVYVRFISANWTGYGELPIIFLIVLFAVYLLRHSKDRVYEFLGPFVKDVYSKHFELEEYQPNSHVPRKSAKASHLFTRDYGFSLFELSGNNLLVGRYRGVHFSYSYIKLSKGGYSAAKSAAFCVLEHRGSVNGRIRIEGIHKTWYSNRTVSGGFDERFEVKTDDQDAAARILTSSFKRKIVELDRVLRTDTTGKPWMEICIDVNCAYIVMWDKKSILDMNHQSDKEIKAAAQEDAGRLIALLDAFVDHPGFFPGLQSDTQTSEWT